MAGKRCKLYPNGVHRFVFYGKIAECKCGHKLKRA